MAPAAADTICQNLMDFNRQPQDYDRIITGDLGYVGQTILLELLKEKGFDIKKQHMDCGIEIYDRKLQDTHSGGMFRSDAFRHDPSENRKRRLEADSFCSDRSTALYGQL